MKKYFSVVALSFLFPLVTFGASTNSKTPVLIIPGVLGVEIRKDNQLLWPNLKSIALSDTFMDPMAFNSDLTPVDNGIFPGLVLTSLTKDVLGQKIVIQNYTQGLINEFIGQGYSEGKDLFTFPYDWRYGVTGLDASGKEVNVEALKGQIDYILNQTDAGKAAGKVDIVAHSTGGLIVKQYVYEHPDDNHIGKAVMVAVPNNGSPKAFKVLVEGDNFGIPGLDPGEMKKLAANMPVVYDLTPNKSYLAGNFLHIHNPLAMDTSKIDTDPTYDDAVAELEKLGYVNPTAIAAAEQMHTRLDTISSKGFDFFKKVDAYNIIGCAVPTFSQFTETINMFAEPTFDFPKLSSGDGTVPQESAGGLTVKDQQIYWVPKIAHSNLLSADGPRQLIVNLITGSKLSTNGKIVDENSFNKDMSVCDLKKGHWWQIFSPVNIVVVDKDGNETTMLPDGSVLNDIPGADLEIFGDHKYLYVPTESGQQYTVKLIGLDEGAFTFKDVEMENGQEVSTQSYENIPVSKNFVASVEFVDDQATLNVDYNGDDTMDQALTPDSPIPQLPEDISNAGADQQDQTPTPTPEPTPTQEPIPTSESTAAIFVGDGSHPADDVFLADTAAGKILGTSTVADGTLVLDSTDNRTVYIIGDGGKKFGFTSEEVFRRFGFNFANLANLDLSNVELGGLIQSTQTVHPDGSLISDGKTIWFVQNARRMWIPNMDYFSSHNFMKQNIVPANVDDLNLSESSF